MTTATFRDDDEPTGSPPLALLKEGVDLGFATYDLVTPPARFWSGARLRPAVLHEIDQARVSRDPTCLELLAAPPPDETVSAQSRRTLARAFAWFLLAEDPQRRLDARAVSTLAHQASLVRHVLSTPALHRVLIADEVGLGKTVEAALIIKELADGNPGLRVLYLAPAGLVRNVQRELTRIAAPPSCATCCRRRCDARVLSILASWRRSAPPTRRWRSSFGSLAKIEPCGTRCFRWRP